MMKPNPLKEKSFCFALRVIKLYKYLYNEKKEFVLSRQLLRSGTAIGALHRESEYAESKQDFVHKLGIAQKECNETLYWIDLLYESEYLERKPYDSLYCEAEELLKIITSSINTAKASINR